MSNQPPALRLTVTRDGIATLYWVQSGFSFEIMSVNPNWVLSIPLTLIAKEVEIQTNNQAAAIEAQELIGRLMK